MSDNTSIPDDLGTQIDPQDVICLALAQPTDLIADLGHPAPLVSVTFGGVDLFHAIGASSEGTDIRLLCASHDTTQLLMAPSGVMGTASTLLSLLTSLDDPRIHSFLVQMHEMLEEALA